MALILALDQGTTSSRAIIFDDTGAIVASAQKEFHQHYPRPGWVEHDPIEIWETQVGVAAVAMRHAGLSVPEIAALGVTNQRETTVAWERATGRPICNAIVWQDRRTASVCQRLREEGLEPLIRHKTGLVLDAYFSGTKIAWILDHVPNARKMAEKGLLAFGTIDSWLIWNLTGGARHITDCSNASRTMLYNIHTGNWDDELLQILNVPRAVLPEVRGSSEVYGETHSPSFPVPIPIGGAAGDQQAALFGQCCFEPGMTKNTYGTGCFLLMNTGKKPRPSRSGLLTTIAWGIGDRVEYALEGSVFIAGGVIQWLRDELKLISSAAESESLASSVENSNGVYLVPAFVGLGAPYWDPYARGAILGLTRGANRSHLIRAALESIAYQTKDVIDCMAQDSGLVLSELRIDGGAAANNFLCQFQADLLGMKVTRPKIVEITALGAAYLAGLAVGYWKAKEELAGHWRVDREFVPQMEHGQREKLLRGWQRAIERSRDWQERD